mgnify:CR=1 FL=1
MSILVFCVVVVMFMAFVLISVTTVKAQDFQVKTLSFSSSLRDTVALGVLTNPEFRQVVHAQNAVRSRLDRAKALRRPTIDLFGDIGYETTEDPFTRASPGSDSETLFRRQVSFTVNQMLFDGHQTKYEIERQRQQTNRARLRVIATAEQLALDIVNAYLNVTRQRELLKITRQNVATHRRIYNRIEESVRAGRLSDVDLQQITARLESARADEQRIYSDLKTAESAFKRVVGVFPQNLHKADIPDAQLPGTLADMIDLALAQNPLIQSAEKGVKVADAELEQSKSPFYPQIDLRLNARHAANLGGIESSEDSLSALIVMTWDLYSGGEDKARLQEFAFLKNVSMQDLAEQIREVESNVRKSWARYQSAVQRRINFAAQAQNNKRLVDAYLDQFQIGRRSLLDVLDIQREYFVAQSNAVNERTRGNRQVFTLLALKGALMPTLGIDYPDLVDYLYGS